MKDDALDVVKACSAECAIGRRAFISQAALVAAATALAGCLTTGDPLAPSSVNGTIKVSDYSSLANVNGVALATVNGAQLAIVRTGTTSFVALSRVCPHMGGIVNSSGNGFTCPRHFAQFSLTGSWVGGQPTSSLHSYPTTYDSANGVLTIG